MIRHLKFHRFNTFFVFLTGFSIGIILTLLTNNKSSKLSNHELVVSIDNFTITADNLYQTLKKSGSVSILINQIDEVILNNLYETTEEITKEIETKATYYLEIANNNYGYSNKEFLYYNNFSNLEELKNNLILEYKRNLYFTDYLKNNIKDKEIKDLYEKIIGSIDGKYIICNDQKIANEIIKKLNNKITYEEIIKIYKNVVTIKELDKIEFDTSLNESIYNELKNLKVNEYSRKYLTIDNKYIILFKDKEYKKENLNDIEDRIKNYLVKKKIKEDDGTLYNKVFHELREKYQLKFYDTYIKKEYLNYLKE